MSANFTLAFGTHKFEMINNAAADAKWVTETSQSQDFARAIVHLLLNTYSFRDTGVYMHRDFDEIRALSWKSDDEGYVYGFAFRKLIEEGKMSYLGVNAIVDTDLYRVAYDGLFSVFGRHVTWENYVEGEAEYKSHNRSAIILMKNLARLEKAQKLGVNVRFVYNTKEAPFFTHPEKGFQKKYDLYEAGDIDAIHSILAGQILEKKTNKALARLASAETKEGYEAPELGEFTVKTATNADVTRSQLIGTTIQIAVVDAEGKVAMTMGKQHPITEENVDRYLVTFEKNKNFRVVFVGEQILGDSKKRTRKGRNVPEAVETK